MVGYDRKKYAVMLREAFQLSIVSSQNCTQDDSSEVGAGEDWADTHFSPLQIAHPSV